MDNYIVINGTKIPMTDEQVNMINATIKPKRQNPFDRVKNDQMYYFIKYDGSIGVNTENDDPYDDNAFDVGNYCTDCNLMKLRALHETLDRLLWRFSMENGGDKIQLSDPDSKKWYIYYDPQSPSIFNTMYTFRAIHVGETYFLTNELADRAIHEIIWPFIEAHPEYKI